MQSMLLVVVLLLAKCPNQAKAGMHKHGIVEERSVVLLCLRRMHHEVFPCIGADGFPGMSHVANFLLAEWSKHAKAVLACYASSQDCIDNYF